MHCVDQECQNYQDGSPDTEYEFQDIPAKFSLNVSYPCNTSCRTKLSDAIQLMRQHTATLSTFQQTVPTVPPNRQLRHGI